MTAATRQTILRRRARDRERQRARRARLAHGERFLALDIEVAPGIVILQVRLAEAVVEDWLIETKRVEGWEADFPEKIDEAIKILLARIAADVTRDIARWRS